MYKPLIGELLDFILPPNLINQNETLFEARFNLLHDEALIRLRFLDNDLDLNTNFNTDLDAIFNSKFLIFNSKHPLSINDDFAESY